MPFSIRRLAASGLAVAIFALAPAVLANNASHAGRIPSAAVAHATAEQPADLTWG